MTCTCIAHATCCMSVVPELGSGVTGHEQRCGWLGEVAAGERAERAAERVLECTHLVSTTLSGTFSAEIW